jgi:hypothetical protein
MAPCSSKAFPLELNPPPNERYPTRGDPHPLVVSDKSQLSLSGKISSTQQKRFKRVSTFRLTSPLAKVGCPLGDDDDQSTYITKLKKKTPTEVEPPLVWR